MTKAVLWFTYKLVAGADVQAFLAAAEALNDAYMSKQSGYVSWQQLLEGDLWADMITFETMADGQKILAPGEINALSAKFYSFIDMETCTVQVFSVEKSY